MRRSVACCSFERRCSSAVSLVETLGFLSGMAYFAEVADQM